MTKLPLHIDKWVKALRSGKYSQQRGALVGDKGYCCLGVYASIMGVDDDDMICSLNEEGPRELYNTMREDIYDHVYIKGIDMNDAGFSFMEIADMIEKEYA